MKLAKPLITGGSGYIARAIKHLYPEVILCGIDNYFNEPKFIEIDLTNYTQLKKVVESNAISSVVHLAALKSINESKSEPTKYLFNNVVSSLNLIKLCEENNIPMVFASTAAVYSKEQTPYSISKKLIEICLKESKINYITLRYYNMGGLIEAPSPNQKGNVFDIIRANYNNKMPFTINKGSTPRDYSHILDSARKTISAIDMVLNKEVKKEFDVLSGSLYTLEDLVNTYKKYGVELKLIENQIVEEPLLTGTEPFGGDCQFGLDDIIKSEIQYGLNLN